MNKEDFIANVVNELLCNQFSVFLHQKTTVEDCGGWFDYENKEFLTAMDNPMGFEIFIHEYSHFLQWKNHTEWFMVHNGGTQILFDWLDGTEYTPDILNLAHRDAVALELHCEQQAIWLIEKYDLPVDLDKYRKAANAYLLFYQFVRTKRSWSKKSPYNNVEIMKAMPTELKPLEYYLSPDSIPDEIRAYFEECLVE